MRILSKLIMIAALAGTLSGCLSSSAMKAPCDAYGTGCGEKIKIYQWYG
jgi:hypothetical protein